MLLSRECFSSMLGAAHLDVLARRLPDDVVWLVLEHAASTRLQAAARGRLVRHPSLTAERRFGFEPLPRAPGARHTSYAYHGGGGGGREPYAAALARWCAALGPGAYSLETNLRFDDGSFSSTITTLLVPRRGLVRWRTPHLKFVDSHVRFFEREHGPARCVVLVAPRELRCRVGQGEGPKKISA